MNDVKYQTVQFIRVIKKSNEYNQYQRLKERLMKDKDLYDRINELRRMNFELQIRPEIDAYEESNRIRSDYEELLNDLVVNEFLIAEQRLCKMIREINNTLVESLDMGLDFLN